MTPGVESISTGSSTSWIVCGHSIPKNELVFLITYLCQVIVVYGVIAASIYNLSKDENDRDKVLWTALLSSSLGYILPNPSLKKITLPSKSRSIAAPTAKWSPTISTSLSPVTDQ